MIAPRKLSLSDILNLPVEGHHLATQFAAPGGLDAVRRRADMAVAATAKASCRRWSLWGWLLIVLSVVLGLLATILPTGGIVEGAAAAAMFLGIVSLVLTEPRQLLRVVEAFQALCDQATQEWRKASSDRAAAHAERWGQAVASFRREALGRLPADEIKAQYREAIEKTRSVIRNTETALVSAHQACDANAETVSCKVTLLRSKASGWFRRFRVGQVRKLTRQVIEFREHGMKACRDHAALEAACRIALARLVGTLEHGLQELEGAQNESERIGATATAEIAGEAFSNVSPDGSGNWPILRDFRTALEPVIEARLEELRSRILNRPAGVPLADAIRGVADELVATQPIISEDLQVQFQRLNGQGKALAAEAASIAKQWNRHNDALAPGEPLWRISTLICREGEASPIFQLFKKQADGCTVRGLHHESASVVYLLNEIRHQRPASYSRLAECAASARRMTADQLALMTPIEDVAWLSQYAPEEAVNPAKLAGLLAMAMVLGIVVRDGAVLKLARGVNCPVELPATGNRLGRGWEQAIANIKSGAPVRRWLEDEVAGQCQTRGAQQVAEMINAALAKPDLVPVEQRDLVTQVLLEERDRRLET